MLKKGFNSIKNEIKNQNYEGQISSQKQILVEKIGAVVTQEKDLCKKINEIISTTNIDMFVNNMMDIDKILNNINTSTNKELIAELTFLEKCNSLLESMKNESLMINDSYNKYFI